MTQTVQQNDTIPLKCSRSTVLSAEETVGTELSALTGPLISTLRGLRVYRASNFCGSTVKDWTTFRRLFILCWWLYIQWNLGQLYWDLGPAHLDGFIFTVYCKEVLYNVLCTGSGTGWCAAPAGGSHLSVYNVQYVLYRWWDWLVCCSSWWVWPVCWLTAWASRSTGFRTWYSGSWIHNRRAKINFLTEFRCKLNPFLHR